MTPPARSRAPWIALGVAVLLAALFVVLALAKPSGSEPNGPQAKNFPAPAIDSQTIDGQPFRLADRRGRWVVINIFDSKCGPCRAEHPELIRFADQQASLGAVGAELVTMISRDSIDNVRAWFAEQGGSWPIVRDDDGIAAVGLGMTAVPETFVIDPAGTVRLRFVGAVTADELGRLVEQLRAAEQ